ncbi:MAG: serine/threonine-protein kinase, partial [Deltaproteobacteria bacterium]
MRWRSKSKIGSPGKIIARRYRLEAPLAGGAMGTIWTAEHVRLKSRVAIKFLDASIADDPEMLARFLREAQSAAAVRGTHVVQIFDCGVEKGDPYIAMELLQGESLEERLTFRGPLAPAELNKIFSEVAIAVDNAHALGVIHRDLKPGNIFLAREGELEITKVLDFGIAKVMNQSLSLATGSGTRTGTVLGTPNYMSPEQARGSSSLDHSTDLWSLAIIAFECLTGQHAFAGQTLGDVMVQICTELPRVPSSLVDVPSGFDQWFLKGASKDPAERFSSAREMAETLSEILVGAAEPVARAADSGARLPDEPPPSEAAMLHSRSVPPLSVAARETSSPSLSPAQLATPSGEPQASVLDSLLSSASGMLHSLGDSLGVTAPLAGLRRSVSKLSVSKLSVSKLSVSP